LIIDGTPYTLKGVRTVWNGGKLGDNIKELPIVIKSRQRIQSRYSSRNLSCAKSGIQKPTLYRSYKSKRYADNRGFRRTNSIYDLQRQKSKTLLCSVSFFERGRYIINGLQQVKKLVADQLIFIYS